MDDLALDVAELFTKVSGFLSEKEVELLFRLALEVPAEGVIVEIGSYQGRSTIALGVGAKIAGARVYAVDPHEDYQVNELVSYGMENHVALLRNLVTFEVADVVRLIGLPSHSAFAGWSHPINVLWIDGSHDYEAVKLDFHLWSLHLDARGSIALHDASGHWPGVSRLLDEILAAGAWDICERVDATVVLRRSVCTD